MLKNVVVMNGAQFSDASSSALGLYSFSLVGRSVRSRKGSCLSEESLILSIGFRDCDQDWHWPCPCEEADSYHEVLLFHGDDPWSRYVKIPRYYAETKRCPSCKLVIEKGAGCNSLTCICGMEFCWLCVQPMSSHYILDEYQPCDNERAPNVINVDRELRLHWKKTTYKSAVKWRTRRYNLAKKSQLDAETMAVAGLACSILEYASAYASQIGNPGICKTVRKEMKDFSFHVELLLDSTMAH